MIDVRLRTDVIPPGTFVTTKVGNIKGQISAVIMRFDEVVYEVSYVATDQFKVITLHEKEFEVTGDFQYQSIGFKNGGK